MLSVGCKGSCLSIGSVGSVLSIGSIGSLASAFSVASAACRGSVMSARSRASVLSYRADGSILGIPQRGQAGATLAGGLLAVTASLIALRALRRSSPGARLPPLRAREPDRHFKQALLRQTKAAGSFGNPSNSTRLIRRYHC